jgi:hypothetical protein
MRRFILALPLLAGACATQPTVHDLANACVGYGYLRETPEFSECMQMEAYNHQQRQQAGLMMLQQQGMAMQQMNVAQRMQQRQLNQPQNVYLHRGFGWR